MNYIKYILCLFIFAFVFIACDKDENDEINNENQNYIIIDTLADSYDFKKQINENIYAAWHSSEDCKNYNPSQSYNSTNYLPGRAKNIVEINMYAKKFTA